MRYIRFISRLFVGLLFAFSGFVKSVDPLGFTYKLTDYFTAFGMEWAESLSFPLAVILIAAEFVVGLNLVFGFRIKLSAWGALLFMAFFTPLTFVLAIDNPVTDCGCFGDALILTNWETFWKNVIILIPTLIVFFGRKKMKSYFSDGVQWSGSFTIIAIIMAFQFYCYVHLPVIDFRPYSVGSHLPDKMVYPEDAEPDEYKTLFYYKNKNTGEVKEFDETNYPWQDTLNWAWDDSKSVLVKEGYHPPIHDFVIESPEDGNIVDLVLEREGYTFLLVAYDITKSDNEYQNQINELATFSEGNNIEFICLTSSVDEEIEKFKSENNPTYKFYACDEITLKTIIRSNPGLVLLKKGTVIGKWSDSDIPTIEEFENEIFEY